MSPKRRIYLSLVFACIYSSLYHEYRIHSTDPNNISFYSSRSESTSKSNHKLLSEDFGFDYFDAKESGFFSWHDQQVLKTVAFQNYQSSLFHCP